MRQTDRRTDEQQLYSMPPTSVAGHNNEVGIYTLAVDGWALAFGTVNRLVRGPPRTNRIHVPSIKVCSHMMRRGALRCRVLRYATKTTQCRNAEHLIRCERTLKNSVMLRYLRPVVVDTSTLTRVEAEQCMYIQTVVVVVTLYVYM